MSIHTNTFDVAVRNNYGWHYPKDDKVASMIDVHQNNCQGYSYSCNLVLKGSY